MYRRTSKKSKQIRLILLDLTPFDMFSLFSLNGFVVLGNTASRQAAYRSAFNRIERVALIKPATTFD